MDLTKMEFTPAKGESMNVARERAPNEPAVQTIQESPETYSIELLFDQENGRQISPPRKQPIVVTAALARAFVRAASLANTGEPPLSFSTLLVALIADEDDWVKTHFQTQKSNFENMANRRPYSELSLRSLTAKVLAGEYLTTTSAHAALDEAARIARLTTGGTILDQRHLVAAYPILPNWHLDDFASFEIDRLEWARAYGAEMAQRFPKERAYWRAYADRASPVPLTSFSADVYTEEDLLDIDRSVDALALLIASTRTVTPLAVGIFGPWGSGKTFFMRHLQKRVVGIRRDEQNRIHAWGAARNSGTAKAEDAPLYFGEIAQVEFNAWHYNEGNLLASLVEHLFRNLRVLPSEGDEVLAQRRADMLKQLKVLTSDLSTVDQAIATAQKNVEDANAEVNRVSQQAEAAKQEVAATASAIESKHEEFVRERQNLDDALRAIQLKQSGIDPEAVIKIALAPLAPFIGRIQTTMAEARDQVFDWRDFGARVFTTKGLLVVALCVGTPMALWLAQVVETQWAALTGSIAAALAAFGNAFDVINRGREQFKEKLRALENEQEKLANEARTGIADQQRILTERAQGEIDALTRALGAQQAALASREAEVTGAARQLADRAREHDAKLVERVAAQEKVRAAEEELKRISSALLLEEFIKDRSSTDEYRKQLGFLALVRRDIERLSKLIDDANRNWLTASNKDAPPLLNRIVLYVDDLDRCKESTVLAVLEAVHLLLAFPLFVCAVAVDPRWVEKCLREAHKELFLDEEGATTTGRSNAPATVGDYLEKIFQIPIWMAPIESRTRATLVNTLLGPTAAPTLRNTRAGQNSAPAQGATSDTRAGGAFNALMSKAREKPDPLRISPEEAAVVEEIAALLSDRPRALKRFVNTYRLLKASLPDIERATFVTGAAASPHRICLSQLAFFTSHPRLAAALVSGLEKLVGDGDGKDTSPGTNPARVTLGDWVDSLDDVPKAGLGDAFKLVPTLGALPLDEFCNWLPMTSRYLFHRAD